MALCKYPKCCVELFKIQLFVHVVKHSEAHHWAQGQKKGSLKYALLLDRAQLHNDLQPNKHRRLLKNRDVTSSQLLGPVHQNTSMMASSAVIVASFPQSITSGSLQCTMQ